MIVNVGTNIIVYGPILYNPILSINGKPMSEWLTKTARHVSADTPYIAHSLLEFWFPKYLWLELGEIDQFRLRLRREGQKARNIIVPARTVSEMKASARERKPSFSLNANARVAHMLDNGIAYLRTGPFYNAENPAKVWDNTAFIAFIDNAFETFLKHNAETLLLDLRQNPGGNNSFSDHMVAWIADKPFRFASVFRIKSSLLAAASNQARIDANPEAKKGVSGNLAKKYAEYPPGESFEFQIPMSSPRTGQRFKGRVFALVNRHSYSNAVNVAAILQDYKFGVIIGEKTSDMATTYGSGETFRLSRTGINVTFPKSHIIRPSGVTQSDGVSPDILIQTHIAPTTEDIVLNEAVKILSRRK